jgi:hypothetical protein
VNETDERDVFFVLIVQKDCFELREMGDRLIDVKDLLIAGFYYLMGERTLYACGTHFCVYEKNPV